MYWGGGGGVGMGWGCGGGGVGAGGCIILCLMILMNFVSGYVNEWLCEGVFYFSFRIRIATLGLY